MHARLILVAAVLTATAFAPAPLPKKERGSQQIVTLQRLQGTWVVEKVERSTASGYQRTSDPLTEILIEGDRWTFVSGGNRSSLGLKIDGGKTPAWFDLGEANTSSTSGIIRLSGNELRVLYMWGRPRPGSFETPPNDYWHITFRRK